VAIGQSLIGFHTTAFPGASGTSGRRKKAPQGRHIIVPSTFITDPITPRTLEQISAEAVAGPTSEARRSEDEARALVARAVAQHLRSVRANVRGHSSPAREGQ
jgi:hypothetical protein